MKNSKKRITKKEAKDALNAGAKRVTDKELKDVIDKADEIQKKFDANGPLGRFIADVKLMISLIQDYWNCKYRQIPYWSIAAIVAALLYVLNPFDLIPDVIPGIGLLDDVAVVSACLSLVEKDLHDYENWKLENVS